ncbi:Re/Si-specific NAD(P)(+) transhydrogenase subunit alpha [Chitiniphilus purpureus]|uniref:proton-translocating NAD(P)(+) transhydrogenase n=1 Tax=Chitiniphilus purpureus TaxID=2981137 RepID=A0ABY6DYT0_9NEIS|nr:Re/Si-specific NAD(P)(+) transhydrogenase subunit alpha [Chitiniphilus sp. CD1]UXY17008.1 Re/Si-specific NAD(P)(+) transhydrogenase subunit alpha [Chitiniphilus sp. CD1]
MLIAIAAETHPGEHRVAATPETVKKYLAQGHTVRVEPGAGLAAAIADAQYVAAGATLVPAESLYAGADVVLRVRAPSEAALAAIPDGATVVALFEAHRYPHRRWLADKRLTAFALERIPRTTRAQAMDVLSSQANVAGYRAVLKAVQHYPRFMPMLMTAAGTVKPARVLILGAGVAGLQAIATARRLGAMVEAFDVRPAAREQVESLGARFVEVPSSEAEQLSSQSAAGYARAMSDDYQARQATLIAARACEADIVIATAQIPGQPAPLLLTEAMVTAMKPGSVIVDLAVDSGGNCALASPDGCHVTAGGVTVLGCGNLAAELAADASALYARNVLAFTALLADQAGHLAPDLADDILAATCIAHRGELMPI